MACEMVMSVMSLAEPSAPCMSTRFTMVLESTSRMMPSSTVSSTDDLTLRIRQIYAGALYEDAGASPDDLREAVTTLEDAARIARRVLGGAHPTTVGIECDLQPARAALRAREETPSSET